MNSAQTIWTIGHSTRSYDELLALIKAHNIELLIDIRTFPGSRKFPHFNKDMLTKALQEDAIRYAHLPGLGGRRKPKLDSGNGAWRNPSFRGYADYMETSEFVEHIAVLLSHAQTLRSAYMCSEAPWWKCHRALVSDYLKIRGWRVLHIMEKGKITEHPFTTAARTVQGKLFYDDATGGELAT